MTRDLTASPLIFHGALITSQSPFLIKYIPHALIYIQNGIIQWIEEGVAHDTQLEAALMAHGLQESNVVKLQRGEFLLPGLIDTHTVRGYGSVTMRNLKINTSHTQPCTCHNSMPLNFLI